MKVIIPILMAKLLDSGIETGNLNNILSIGVLLVLCAIFSLRFGMLSGRFASIASNGFAKNLRHDLYYKVQDYSFKNIDKYSTSSIITRLTTDVTNVQNAYQMIIRIAVRAPLMFIFSLLMVFIINKKISIIFLVVVPILFGLLILIAKIAHPYFEAEWSTMAMSSVAITLRAWAVKLIPQVVLTAYHKVTYGSSGSARLPELS